MLRRLLPAVSAIALAAGCGDGDDRVNPFDDVSASRPPSADAVLLFVSGSWSEAPGRSRELFALNADGSTAQRLTACGQRQTPCDILEVAPSPDRNRVAAIRTTPGAEAGASTLYFMDLSRSVETILFPRRRIDSVDWSPDGSFIIYSAIVPQTGGEDLFFSQPDGKEERNLTESLTVRDLNPRIDPFARTVVYEQIDGFGVSRVYLYRDTPLTSGPAGGEALPGTPYVVGADADPVLSPDGVSIAFRRLTGTGNGGLGTWDLLVQKTDVASPPVVVASGPLFRGAPDWGRAGLVFVETDAARSVSEIVRLQPGGTGRTVLRTENAAYLMGSPRWLPGN